MKVIFFSNKIARILSRIKKLLLYWRGIFNADVRIFSKVSRNIQHRELHEVINYKRGLDLMLNFVVYLVTTTPMPNMNNISNIKMADGNFRIFAVNYENN